MTSEVGQMIEALRNGTMSLDEVAEDFRHRSWPSLGEPYPRTYQELTVEIQEDPDLVLPGSFDDVDIAHYQGKLTDTQYNVLSQAMTEAVSKNPGSPT